MAQCAVRESTGLPTFRKEVDYFRSEGESLEIQAAIKILSKTVTKDALSVNPDSVGHTMWTQSDVFYTEPLDHRFQLFFDDFQLDRLDVQVLQRT